MGDRLSVARRAYLYASRRENAAYAEAVKPAHELWGKAAAEARSATRRLGVKTFVDNEVILEYSQILTDAGDRLRAALAPLEAEIRDAVAEAKRNGTFHWGAAEPVAEPDFDEGGWLDECEL